MSSSPIETLPPAKMKSPKPENPDDDLSKMFERLALGEEAPVTISQSIAEKRDPVLLVGDSPSKKLEGLGPEEEAPITFYQSVVKKRDPVLLVGESPTRALTMSLAVQRGSFKGIWSTSYNKSASWSYNDLQTELNNARERADKNGPGGLVPKDAFDKFDSYVRHRLSINHPIFDRLIGEIDATKLSEFVGWSEFVKRKRPLSTTVWFQCPWTFNQGYNVSELIQRVVKDVATFQTTGDILLFGLVNEPRYHCKYGHEKMISTAKEHGYTHSEDKELIQKCIEHGYRHWTDAISHGEPLNEGCHDWFARFDLHLTHIFTKK